MPLLDHFHPPLAASRRWEGFHSAWANGIVGVLNRDILPEGYFAEAQIHIGSQLEVDVGTLDVAEPERPGADDGGVALLTWAPPATALVVPTDFPDAVEVLVYSSRGGPTLVAAVELVSPGNKDRPEARRAFAAKCLSYLQAGVGLVVVDVVTERRANLHDELIAVWEKPESYRFPGAGPLYAVAYRPSRASTEPGGDRVEVWPYSMAVGEGLPTVPLALRRGPTLPLDLDKAYNDARALLRL